MLLVWLHLNAIGFTQDAIFFMIRPQAFNFLITAENDLSFVYIAPNHKKSCHKTFYM